MEYLRIFSPKNRKVCFFLKKSHKLPGVFFCHKQPSFWFPPWLTVFVVVLKQTPKLLFFFRKNGQRTGFFETKENKAKRLGDSKKKGVQKSSENFFGFRPAKI